MSRLEEEDILDRLNRDPDDGEAEYEHEKMIERGVKELEQDFNEFCKKVKHDYPREVREAFFNEIDTYIDCSEALAPDENEGILEIEPSPYEYWGCDD